jgi:hypothetical protein
MQWTASNNGIGSQVVNDTTTLSVIAGKVDIGVEASEAVMVFVKQ